MYVAEEMHHKQPFALGHGGWAGTECTGSMASHVLFLHGVDCVCRSEIIQHVSTPFSAIVCSSIRILCDHLDDRFHAQKHGRAVASMGVDLVDACLSAVDGEKDPRCLLLLFSIIQVCCALHMAHTPRMYRSAHRMTRFLLKSPDAKFPVAPLL